MVVIADWEALPVAEASPDAVPVTSDALSAAGFKMLNAAEGEAEAPSEREEATPCSRSVRVYVKCRAVNSPWQIPAA